MNKTNYEIAKECTEFEENGLLMINEVVYKVYEDGTKEVLCSVTYPKLSIELTKPEPTDEEILQAQILLNQADILAR